MHFPLYLLVRFVSDWGTSMENTRSLFSMALTDLPAHCQKQCAEYTLCIQHAQFDN